MTTPLDDHDRQRADEKPAPPPPKSVLKRTTTAITRLRPERKYTLEYIVIAVAIALVITSFVFRAPP